MDHDRQRNTSSPVPAKATPHPDGDAVITHCSVCGRAFGKRAKWTLTRWFGGGTPRLSDICHPGCSGRHNFRRWLKRHPAIEAELDARQVERIRQEIRDARRLAAEEAKAVATV